MDAKADTVVAYVKDLMLASRITTAAKSAGVEVRIVRSAGPLGEAEGGLLLVDLSLQDAIAGALAWRDRTAGRVVGFAPHVDTAGLAAAASAGIGCLARGALVAQLPSLLGSCLKGIRKSD